MRFPRSSRFFIGAKDVINDDFRSTDYSAHSLTLIMRGISSIVPSEIALLSARKKVEEWISCSLAD